MRRLALPVVLALVAGALYSSAALGARGPYERCCFRYDVGVSGLLVDAPHASQKRGTYEISYSWDERGIFKAHGFRNNVFFAGVAGVEGWFSLEDDRIEELTQVLVGNTFQDQWQPTAACDPRDRRNFLDSVDRYKRIKPLDFDGGISPRHEFKLHCLPDQTDFTGKPPMNALQPENDCCTFRDPPADWVRSGTGTRTLDCLVRRFQRIPFGDGNPDDYTAVKGVRTGEVRFTYFPPSQLGKWKKKLARFTRKPEGISVKTPPGGSDAEIDAEDHPGQPFPSGTPRNGCHR
jgi:hypothetical protein